MLIKIKEYFLKYKEVITYLIFGGLTTIINFVTYIVCTKIFNIDDLISNIIAWIISVLFAYITNKIVVFESKSKDKKTVFKEMISFFTCRIISLVLFDILLFWLLIDICHINDIIVKIINQILIVIANYLFSKLIIFKKK